MVDGVATLIRGRQLVVASNISGLADKFIGGWQVTSFFQWASGEPADYPANVLPLRNSSVNNINWNQHQVRGFGNCVGRQNNDGSRTPMP